MKKLLIVLNVVAVLCILKYASFLFLWKLPQDLELIAFDIGQGDSLMLTVPNSSIQILIDGGPDDKVVEKLQKYLPAGDNFVDVIILTHGHDDHVGGLPSVIENFEVGLVIDTGAICDNTNYQKMVEQIELLSLPKLYAVRGEKIRIGSDFILEIIHPFFSQNVEYKNLNDASITATVSYQEKKIVLTGDLEIEGEREILKYLQGRGELEKLKAGVLKIGHHGSKTATSIEFLKAINPQQAVISSGKENSFGHPHQETITKLKKEDVKIFRTDKGEDVLIKL